MKLKKRLLIFTIVSIIISIFIISTFYIFKSRKREVAFYDFINNINEERKFNVSNSTPLDISKYMENKNINEEIFTNEDLEELTNYKYVNENISNKILTLNEANKDIEYTFKLLKYVYGPYEYFGGDGVFLKKENEILNELANIENIKYDDIKKLLLEELSFINDGHFSISNSSININKNSIYVYNEDYIFRKDTKGYYTTINNTKWYATSIDEKPSDKYMKSTITKDGELAYSIGMLLNNSGDIYPLNISLTNNKTNETIDKIVNLKRNLKANKTPEASVTEKTLDNIPILKIMSMRPTNPNDNSLYDFVESAERLNKNKVLIIDLRGNIGGAESLWKKWLNAYMGQDMEITQSVGKKNSKAKLWAYKKYIEKFSSDKELLIKINSSINNEDYGYWDSYLFNGKWYENENLVFVLVDDDVASASEGFLSYLRNIENIIFVGSNSRGCLLVPDTSEFSLPNSNIILRFGTGIAFKNTDTNMDGVGFEPDIWVNSSDALDRVLKLCERYNISSMKHMK
ncbi:periplasmic protease [Clostridium putrefaciens]|uniref:Periplasmic protease n=1 Tax=Clostridium putrefaciens TaxID=99675 RepID=A0A381J5Y9_9CLOT|nr:S41 family peptidase [Clostridium putrefaciens]SUY46336.1 periplasmic protease [Clostridium putrefaciens]